MATLQLYFLLLWLPELLAVPLLVSWTTSINLMENSNTTTLVTSANQSVAVDYHHKRGEFYFSNGQGRIYRGWLRPEAQLGKPIVIVEVKGCDGLAVDWQHDRLYWTDYVRHTLETATLDGLQRRTLFSSLDGLEKPRAVVLDPNEGLLFWSDWGDEASIESAGLDGKEKHTIMSSTVGWPNGLTVDLIQKRLYVLDAMHGIISSCRYDGRDRRTVSNDGDSLMHGFGLTLYDGQLFWDSWRTHAIYSWQLSDDHVSTIFKRHGYRAVTERLMGLKAVHPSLQRDSVGADPCAALGCSHFCLTGRNHSATCHCLYGFKLQADQKTCSEEGYMMVSWTKTLRRYTLEGGEEEPMIDSALFAVALDYHYRKQLLFWSDNDQNRIYSAPLNQLNNMTEVANVRKCDGLAVDWRHDVLYWTDSDANTVEVARLDGADHRVLITDQLDEPRALALDPKAGRMFWTDWGAEARVESAHMDGSDRRTLVAAGVVWPNGLTLDMEQERVCWVDGSLGTMECVQYNGTGRVKLISSSPLLRQPFAISLLKDQVFWTDWATLTVYQASMPPGTHANPLGSSSLKVLRPTGMKVIHSSLQPALDNPCLNLGCLGLCVGGNSPQKPHCLGHLLVNSSGVENEGFELTLKAFNDSVVFSPTKWSKTLNLVVVHVQCIRRKGCEDKSCEHDDKDDLRVFSEEMTFNVTNLLPATEYKLTLITLTVETVFPISTTPNDPPEVPRLMSVEVTNTTALVKWQTVDTCFPGFKQYNYILYKEGGRLPTAEGGTNGTEVSLLGLQPQTNYSVRVFTVDPQHFSHIDFTTERAVDAHCKAENLQCDGHRDCLDGSDEAVSVCARLGAVTIHDKSRSWVTVRCDVSSSTRRVLASFLGSYTIRSYNTNLTFQFRSPAVPCTHRPLDLCFIITNLAPYTHYNLTVSAELKNGDVGNELSMSFSTFEEAPGAPEDLTEESVSDVSIALRWRRPTHSLGVESDQDPLVREYLIFLKELETFIPDKCCQSFPVIEHNDTELVLGGMWPASTYAVSVSASTWFSGPATTLLIHTGPPPMAMQRQPSVIVSANQADLVSWNPPNNDLTADQQYLSLITSYLLVVLPPPGSPSLNASKVSVDAPLAALLDKTLDTEHVVVCNRHKDDKVAWLWPVTVNTLTPGLHYQLAWVQVSQFKDKYNLDILLSLPFIAS